MESVNTEQELREAHSAICKMRGINPNAPMKLKPSRYQANQARIRDREQLLADLGELDPSWTVNVCGPIGR